MMDKDTIRKIMNFEDSPPEDQGQVAETIPTGQPQEAQADPSQPAPPAVEAEAPKESGVDDLFAEYGVSDADVAEDYKGHAETLQARIASLESELESMRLRVSNKVYSMDEAEINAKVEELREAGKHAEAQKILTEWSQRDQFKPENVSAAKLEISRRNLMEYAQKVPSFSAIIQRPELQKVLPRFENAVNLDRPGGVEALHLIAKGLLANEMIRKSFDKGRGSVTLSPPAKISTQQATKPDGTAAYRRQPTMSDRLAGKH